MKVYNLNEVYGISRDVPLNYIERKNVDEKFKRNLTREKHVTIFGSSKQGKTCLRKHCLDKDDYILVQCNNKWSLTELNSNLLKRAGYEIEISSKKTSGGKAKVIASFKAAFGFAGVNTSAEAEKKYDEEVSHKKLEIDLDDANDIIAALREIKFNG